MKILYLTTVLPSKKLSGGEIVSQYFIDALKQSGHEVLILGFQRRNDLLKNNKEVSVGERYIETKQARFYPILWMLLSFLRRIPYSSAKYYSKIYVNKINLLLSYEDYDVVVIDHSQLAWLTTFINKSKVKLIVNSHNIEHELYTIQFNNTPNSILKWIYKREAQLFKDIEKNLANTAEEVWTLTPSDCKYFSSVKKGGRVRVFAVPSSLTTLPDQPAEKNCDVGIIGTWTWKANSSGLKWFFQAVYPYLPANLLIQVAGKGAEWLHGRYSNVKYCGFVPSAQAFMAQAKVIAIPSISGSGVQIKTLDAIASGSPVIATPVALRGISEYPCSVSVAEKPEDFAKSLTNLVSLHTQDFCQHGIAWSQSRREKFFADVGEAITALQRERVR